MEITADLSDGIASCLSTSAGNYTHKHKVVISTVIDYIIKHLLSWSHDHTVMKQKNPEQLLHSRRGAQTRLPAGSAHPCGLHRAAGGEHVTNPLRIEWGGTASTGPCSLSDTNLTTAHLQTDTSTHRTRVLCS